MSVQVCLRKGGVGEKEMGEEEERERRGAGSHITFCEEEHLGNYITLSPLDSD